MPLSPRNLATNFKNMIAKYMVDKGSDAQRSAIMSKVKSKNTRPEMMVRRMLHKLGYLYRLHLRNLPGKPDLAFPGRRKAVFVHGCFWHRYWQKRFLIQPKQYSLPVHQLCRLEVFRQVVDVGRVVEKADDLKA